ncbi:MAG: hypothetical protein HY908_35055 [Myxococcales bacterium]|nr:hypothetical protein [Myxococcales bacterium]
MLVLAIWLGIAAALRGVGQQALSVSYLLLYRADGPVMPYARAGVSVLTAPDPNVGGELAAGGAYFFTGALGLSAELVGNLFYGAGTYDRQYTAYPVLSLELGLLADLEVLP